MYFFIDNSIAGKIVFAVTLHNKVVQDVVGASGRTLLVEVEDFLKKYQMNICKIEGVAVRVGVGSFTNTRIAVTLANAIAYACQIPVAAVLPDESIELAFEKILNIPVGQYVAATYSGEPNIGKKK